MKDGSQIWMKFFLTPSDVSLILTNQRLWNNSFKKTLSGAFVGMNKSPFSIVCDAGPLIHLDELDCLDLLSDFSKIFISDAVLQEIKFHRPQVLQNSQFSFEQITINQIQHIELETLIASLSLHEGEQEALAYILTTPDSILITDDSTARLAAITLKLKVHGTIGIIIRAVRRKQKTITEVIDIIRSIPLKSSLHIKPSLLNKILQQLKDDTN